MLSPKQHCSIPLRTHTSYVHFSSLKEKPPSIYFWIMMAYSTYLKHSTANNFLGRSQ